MQNGNEIDFPSQGVTVLHIPAKGVKISASFNGEKKKPYDARLHDVCQCRTCNANRENRARNAIG